MNDRKKDSLFDPQSCVLSTEPSRVENVIGKEESHTNRDRRPPQPYLAPGDFIPASELMEMQFQDPLWLVRGLLPKGLTVLAGKPKAGKSWLALALGLELAAGGSVLGHRESQPCTVLYLALEDTPRRLKTRILKLEDVEPVSDRLLLSTEWRNFGDYGVEDLEILLETNPDIALVIIDTWQRVRGSVDGFQGIYGQDYNDVAELKSVADRHGIAIILVHHVKKGDEQDPLDQVSGSTGITGAADAIWVLKRNRNATHGELHILGRDLEERELAVSFDKETCTWSVLGDAGHFDMTPEQREVLQALQEHGPMKPKQAGEILGVPSNTAGQRLLRMCNHGLVEKLEDGSYATLT
jgi:hypothetical protein